MTALIVGNTTDEHVAAVTELLPTALVIDATTVDRRAVSVEEHEVRVGGRTIDVRAGTRGWLRRLAPGEWRSQVRAESLEAAEKAATLSVLTSIIRSLPVQWLTPIDAAAAAENKPHVYANARRIGVQVPQTIVTNDPQRVRERFNGRVVLKPLAHGYFLDKHGDAWNIFAETINTRDLDDGLRRSPFLVQEVVEARQHLRVVTVHDRVWVTCLEAAGLPLDWRSDPAAHGQFLPAGDGHQVASLAAGIAAELELGYSSQDWVLGPAGVTLLDVNPGGQWLFLPSPVREEVADAIRRWLAVEPA
ncbi:RimK family alpha-L-glutamate ligase [Curtobacterium flaccumfaciens]|uniref:RimK family alpha-L-glutamate ligase n=1 Tax=Curtobacterium flaccumfaciens TaxID=2035 RepID=UPI003879E968